MHWWRKIWFQPLTVSKSCLISFIVENFSKRKFINSTLLNYCGIQWSHLTATKLSLHSACQQIFNASVNLCDWMTYLVHSWNANTYFARTISSKSVAIGLNSAIWPLIDITSEISLNPQHERIEIVYALDVRFTSHSFNFIQWQFCKIECEK